MSLLALLFGICIATLAVFVPGSAAAVWIPPAPCTGLIGCGGGPLNILRPANFVVLATWMLQITAGLAVLMIVWSGFQMIINMGDESKVTTARTHILFALGGLTLALLSQFLVSAISTQVWILPGTESQLPIEILATGVRVLRTLVNGVLAIVIVWGGLYMILDHGKQEYYKKGQTMLKGAIIGAVIINLGNALVQGIATFFNL